VQKGDRAEVLYLTLGGGMGITKDRGKKSTKEILEGRAEMRRCGWYRLGRRRVMEGE